MGMQPSSTRLPSRTMFPIIAPVLFLWKRRSIVIGGVTVKSLHQNCFSVAAKLSRKFAFAGALALTVFALLAATQSTLAGDIDSAKQQLEKVKSDVSNSSWDSIADDIKATEDFLEGTPPAERAPIQKELDALKEKAAVILGFTT